MSRHIFTATIALMLVTGYELHAAEIEVAIGKSILIPLPAEALQVNWPLSTPTGGTDPSASSDPDVVSYTRTIGQPGELKIVATAKSFGSATLTCEYGVGTGGATRKVVNVTVWVTQDVERVNRILTSYDDPPHTPLRATLTNGGERVRITGTVKSHSVLHDILRSLPNEDLTIDRIELNVTCHCQCCSPTMPSCRGRRFSCR